MITKNKERLLLVTFCLAVLIFCILLEKSSYEHLFFSLFGGNEFYSIFDRMKFILPIALLLLLSTDYSMFSLKSRSAYVLPRYMKRKKWMNKIFSDLYLSNFLFIVLIITISIIMNTAFKTSIAELFQVDFIILFLVTYFLYNLIVTIQLLLSIMYSTSVSFMAMIIVVVASTFIGNNYFRFILIVPIGMYVFHDSYFYSIISICIMALLNLIVYRLVQNKIENIDLR